VNADAGERITRVVDNASSDDAKAPQFDQNAVNLRPRPEFDLGGLVARRLATVCPINEPRGTRYRQERTGSKILNRKAAVRLAARPTTTSGRNDLYRRNHGSAVGAVDNPATHRSSTCRRL
jgi:hypothetical protein